MLFTIECLIKFLQFRSFHILFIFCYSLTIISSSVTLADLYSSVLFKVLILWIQF